MQNLNIDQMINKIKKGNSFLNHKKFDKFVSTGKERKRRIYLFKEANRPTYKYGQTGNIAQRLRQLNSGSFYGYRSVYSEVYTGNTYELETLLRHSLNECFTTGKGIETFYSEESLDKVIILFKLSIDSVKISLEGKYNSTKANQSAMNRQMFNKNALPYRLYSK